jgi:hypothetical protein
VAGSGTAFWVDGVPSDDRAGPWPAFLRWAGGACAAKPSTHPKRSRNAESATEAPSPCGKKNNGVDRAAWPRLLLERLIFQAVVGTKVITRRLAVSLLMRVATGQTRCATSGVPFSRAALSNKDVWRLLLRATLIAAAIALLSFGGAGPKMNAAI